MKRLWARLWNARPWAWSTVRDTRITLYQQHASGERRVLVREGCGYQPVDWGWLNTGEWTNWSDDVPQVRAPRRIAGAQSGVPALR